MKPWGSSSGSLGFNQRTFQPSFSEFYVYELYNDLIDDSMFDTDKIRLELEKLSTSDRNYYGGDKKWMKNMLDSMEDQLKI